MYRFFLAVRYLFSRPINLLGMFGVMLGVWALIVVVSIFSGFLVVASEHVKSAGSDISVFYIPDGITYEQLREEIEADPNVEASSPRLVHYGLLHPRAGRPAQRGSFAELLPGGGGPYLAVLGVDPQRVVNTTGMRGWLEAVTEPELRVADVGAPLSPGGTDELPGILLGRDRMLAEGLHRGDRVKLTTGRLVATEDGSRTVEPLPQEFVVAGAYATRHLGFDQFNTFVHIDALRELLAPGQGDVVNEVSVKVLVSGQIEETADRLQRTVHRELNLPGDPRIPLAYSWRQRNRALLESVEHQRALMKIVLFVIMVVAAFLMYATLSMMVTEKTHDIGILTAMGATPLGVMQVFLFCGLTITGAGMVLGTVAGCLSSVYLDDFNKFMRATFDIDLFPTKVYNIDHVPYELDALWIAQVAGMALLVGALVSALPAIRAARHDPLVSLRNE